MANTLNLLLTDGLQAFIEENCDDGTPYATRREFVLDLLQQKKQQIEAAHLRAALVEGYQDAIEDRTVPFEGELRSLLRMKRS